MKIVTHNGQFHTDELMGVATLKLIYPEAEIIRTRTEEIINSADIVLDVGLVYDREKKRFDHHQSEGAGVRENGIPYASFGLVWKEYGKDICGSEEASQVVEEKLVLGIDSIDNGITLSKTLYQGVREYSFGDFIFSFAEGKKDLQELDQAFFEVLPLAIALLKREVDDAKRKVEDWKVVKEIYDSLEDKRIIVLPEITSWKKVLVPLETLYVVAERPDKSWIVRAVPKSLDSFELKKALPKEWGGLSGEELEKVTGVPHTFFCHKDLFMAANRTQEGALALAQIALNS